MGDIFSVYLVHRGICARGYTSLSFPPVAWGEGLLLGTDSVSYHQIALNRFYLIRKFGWGNWILSPFGQTPAGIASFFYVLISPKPWVMLPIFAALQAGSVCLLLKIVSLLENKTNQWVRLAVVIPFLVFPSAAIIYGQLLKDVYFIFGNLLFIYGWLRWLKQRHLAEERFPFGNLFYAFYCLPWLISRFGLYGLIGDRFSFLWSLAFLILITMNQGWFFFTAEQSWRKRGDLLDIIPGFSLDLWPGHAENKTSTHHDHRSPRQ